MKREGDIVGCVKMHTVLLYLSLDCSDTELGPARYFLVDLPLYTGSSLSGRPGAVARSDCCLCSDDPILLALDVRLS